MFYICSTANVLKTCYNTLRIFLLGKERGLSWKNYINRNFSKTILLVNTQFKLLETLFEKLVKIFRYQ